jgi:hypothetical protein
VVQNAGHVHFSLPVEGEALDYLGYILDGSFDVRGTVCPSCGSQGLSYGGDALVETPPDEENEDTSWPRCCGR